MARTALGARLGHRDTNPGGSDRRLIGIGAVLFSCQFVALGVLSILRYQHFALAEDYGIYAQAMHEIAHGHFDPYTTVYGYSFWQNNFEWYIWPLGLLSRVIPAPILLLGLQDGCLALTGWLALLWWRQTLTERGDRLGTNTAIVVAGLGVLIVPLVSPLIYATAAFDFHSEAIAAPLVAAVGYDLWGRRTRRCWIWVVLLISTSGVAGTYLVAVALAAVLAGRSRPTALSLVFIGAGWLALASAIGGVRPGVVDGYTYLSAGGQTTSITGIVGGLIAHPVAPLRTIGGRWRDLARITASSGVLGALWPPALMTDLAVVIPPALNVSPVFVSSQAAFQVIPILGPMVAGIGVTGIVLVRRLGKRAALAASIGITAFAVVCPIAAAVTAPSGVDSWTTVPASTAHTLARLSADIPQDTEVVAASGISGRLSTRPFSFILSESSVVFPVCAPEVLVVLTDAGPEGGFTPPAMVETAREILAAQLHAALLISSHGVWVYRLRPGRETAAVDLDPSIATSPLSCRAAPPRSGWQRAPSAIVDPRAQAPPKGAD